MKLIMAPLLFGFFACFFFVENGFSLIINLEKTPPQKKVAKPKLVGPVVLDTRKTFDYSMAHVSGSLPIRWQDFSQTEAPHQSALDPDESLLARRLRIMGITPEREVIVLGLGKKGQGEEGRIAWMLAYLGVKNIKVLNYENYKAGKITANPRPDVDEAALWIPKPVSTLRVKISELELSMKDSEKTVKNAVDLRSEGEFKKEHIPGAVSVPWQKFVGSDGEMLTEGPLKELLKENKVDLGLPVIFYGGAGSGYSGFATFAAFRAGLKARNFDGSFEEWVSGGRLPVARP